MTASHAGNDYGLTLATSGYLHRLSIACKTGQSERPLRVKSERIYCNGCPAIKSLHSQLWLTSAPPLNRDLCVQRLQRPLFPALVQRHHHLGDFDNRRLNKRCRSLDPSASLTSRCAITTSHNRYRNRINLTHDVQVEPQLTTL